jgi:hypothetical protein
MTDLLRFQIESASASLPGAAIDQVSLAESIAGPTGAES